MKPVVIATTVLALFVSSVRVVEAGCVCPPVTNVRVGDLDVAGAVVTRQRWTIAPERVEVELVLAGASAATTIQVLASAVPKGESDPELDPRATATIDGTELIGRVSRADGIAHVRWGLGTAAKRTVTVKLAWNSPHAGEDGDPLTKARVEAFCIDAGTRKGLERAHGFLRVDLALSKDMASGFALRVARDRLPLSLCARNVKRVGKGVFEIRGRQNLQDRGGVVPILWGASI